MRDDTDGDRRRFLRLAGATAAVGLAGCAGPGGAESPTGAAGEVPAAYETATSVGGTRRDPATLSSKEAVDYQSQPNDGEQCAGCRFYIEDKNGDGMGACAIVEGQIDPNGWCASFTPVGTETGSG